MERTPLPARTAALAARVNYYGNRPGHWTEYRSATFYTDQLIVSES